MVRRKLSSKFSVLAAMGLGAAALVAACSADNGTGSGFTNASGSGGSGSNHGSTGAGGDMGVGSLVGSNGSGSGPGSGGGCAGTSSKAEQIPLDMYIMLDQSGSMSGLVPGGTRWTAVTQALATFV